MIHFGSLIRTACEGKKFVSITQGSIVYQNLMKKKHVKNKEDDTKKYKELTDGIKKSLGETVTDVTPLFIN